jgi:pimeloyl-ACP methyl ester carboxylesterase
MSHSHPHFIFVPGAFSPAHYFHKVIALLSPTYTASAIELPSMSASLRADNAQPGLYSDATHVRDIARASLSQGHDVILVGNSYGGAVCMEACKTLVEPHNQSKGQVRHIVMLCSLMADKDFTIAQLIGGNLPIDVEARLPSTAVYHEPIDPAIAGAVLCGSLPKAEQDEYASMGRPICAQAFTEPLTFAAWREVPTTLVIGDKDMALPMEKQVEFFEKAVEKGAKKARKVVVEGGDHLVMLSHPEEVVKVCLEAGGIET